MIKRSAMILAAPLANLAALCTLETSQRMPTYEYNWFGQNRYRATSSEPLPLQQDHDPASEFKYDGGGPAKGGNVTMLPERQEGRGGTSGRDDIWSLSPADETFDIGLDTGSPVRELLYASPFKFAGAINRVEVTADCRRIISSARDFGDRSRARPNGSRTAAAARSKRNGRRGDSAFTPAQINARCAAPVGALPKGTQPRSQGRLGCYSA